MPSPFPPTRASRAFVSSVLFFACTVAVIDAAPTTASASVRAAKTTTKPSKTTTKASRSTAAAKKEVTATRATNAAGPVAAGDAIGAAASTTLTPATLKPTTTTSPKPISAGSPIKGWDSIGLNEWPVANDAIVATARSGSLEVFRIPGDRTGVLRLDRGRSVFGALNLLALGSRDDWVRVAIPLRPNGTVGWVRRPDVTLTRSTLRVVVDLSANVLTVTDGPDKLLSVKVAAGTGGTPTPTGLFFLKELVPQSNPAGSLGPFAFGLSGYSTVLTSFAGGEGTIGIHGTNTPGKLGGDVSHGCVRVDNATITYLARILPLGTPVEITNSADQLPTNAFRRSSDWLFAPSAANASPTGAAGDAGGTGTGSASTPAGSATTTSTSPAASTTTTTSTSPAASTTPTTTSTSPAASTTTTTATPTTIGGSQVPAA